VVGRKKGKREKEQFGPPWWKPFFVPGLSAAGMRLDGRPGGANLLSGTDRIGGETRHFVEAAAEICSEDPNAR